MDVNPNSLNVQGLIMWVAFLVYASLKMVIVSDVSPIEYEISKETNVFVVPQLKIVPGKPKPHGGSTQVMIQDGAVVLTHVKVEMGDQKPIPVTPYSLHV